MKKHSFSSIEFLYFTCLEIFQLTAKYCKILKNKFIYCIKEKKKYENSGFDFNFIGILDRTLSNLKVVF